MKEKDKPQKKDCTTPKYPPANEKHELLVYTIPSQPNPTFRVNAPSHITPVPL
jgi:hypothetical protein